MEMECIADGHATPQMFFRSYVDDVGGFKEECVFFRPSTSFKEHGAYTVLHGFLTRGVRWKGW
jgi:hypothetical protein